MKERIRMFIENKGLSPGDLAGILGVQRSNISHILNGRNKPGAVFIEKLLQVFPQLNARWLFTGEGSMLTEADGEDLSLTKTVAAVESEPKIPYKSNKSTVSPSVKEISKTLNKVVLLYSDGTFESFGNI